MKDDLFEVDPNGPDAPVRATFVRRPREEPDPDEPSPFGAARPEDLPPAGESYGPNASRVTVSGTKAVSKPRQHYPRVVTLLERETGGMFWACDSKKIAYGGVQVSTDLLGFMDIQGVVAGQLVGVNVTSRAGIAAHLRDYTDPRRTHGSGRVPVEALLRRFLACGGRLIILGYEKRKSRWHYERVEVTPSLLDEYKARKRGPRR